MIKTTLCSLTLLVSNLAIAQEFHRREFDYTAIEKTSIKCDESTLAILSEALSLIDRNQSAEAVLLTKNVYDNDKSCPGIYDAYGVSLFRNGKLLEGIAAIEDGIDKFGSDAALITSRYQMSLELYHIGTGRKNIDGNAVYSGRDKLPFDEEKFKRENLKSAQRDLEYLAAKFPDSLNYAFVLGRVYGVAGEHQKARGVFEKLRKNEDYRYDATLGMADAMMAAEDYRSALAELEMLTVKYPEIPNTYEKLAEAYNATGNAGQSEINHKKAIFYDNVPRFSGFSYSDANYDLLALFGSDGQDGKKFARLKEISNAADENFTADVCLLILRLHANHGNGLEDQAAKILTRIGKPAIEKVNRLFTDNISTCTVTYLAEIMATVKDESSWNVMADYLPYMASMPMTIIPPDVPAQMVRFDTRRGTVEVLKVVKEMLAESGHGHSHGFAEHQFYAALRKVDSDKVLKWARETGYSESEIAALKENLKK